MHTNSSDSELNQGPLDKYSLQSNALPTELSLANTLMNELSSKISFKLL